MITEDIQSTPELFKVGIFMLNISLNGLIWIKCYFHGISDVSCLENTVFLLPVFLHFIQNNWTNAYVSMFDLSSCSLVNMIIWFIVWRIILHENTHLKAIKWALEWSVNISIFIQIVSRNSMFFFAISFSNLVQKCCQHISGICIFVDV